MESGRRDGNGYRDVSKWSFCRLHNYGEGGCKAAETSGTFAARRQQPGIPATKKL